MQHIMKMGYVFVINDSFYKNGNLSANLMVKELSRVFFAPLEKNRNDLIFPVKETKLFAYYDNNIETPFLENSTLTKDLIDLSEVMLWAMYRVWVTRVFDKQEIVQEFTAIDEEEILNLFIENLDSPEDKEFLGKLNFSLEE